MDSTIRYLYNTAITGNKTERLVLSFDDNTYWAEETSEKFLLDKGDDKNKKDKKPEEKKEEPKKEALADSGATAEGKAGDEQKEVSYVEPVEASFGAVDTPIISIKALPGGLSFKDVWTEHDKEPIGSGKAYIYFFPSGYSEAAVINLKDADDQKHVSIRINPFNGDVDITAEYRKLEMTNIGVKK